MTWGSNATYNVIPCRFCGEDSIDDEDNGLNSHEQNCPHGDPSWTEYIQAGLTAFLIIILCVAASAAWGGAHGDAPIPLPYEQQPADPVTLDTGIYTTPGLGGSGDYVIRIDPGEGHYQDVTFTNRLVRTILTPEEFTFVLEDGNTVLVFIESGKGDLPDVIYVAPPDGYVAIPSEVLVPENETVVIEIHEYVIG